MVETGQILRQAREAKELTLEDVESKTRIRQRYLSALESGDWDDLPSPVAARGFLRTYATFLGLDADELLSQVQDENGSELMAPTASAPSDYRPINLDIYSQAPGRSPWRKRALGLALILIPLVIIGYALYRYGLPALQQLIDKNAPATATVILPPEGTVANTPMIVATATPLPTIATQTPAATVVPADTQTPTPQPTPTATSTATPAPANSIQLQVQATQTAWIRVVVDGEVQVESLQDPGYEQTFVATRQLEFLTGNAGGVHLTLNGQPVNDLGEVGEIAIFIWNIQDDKIVEVTPTPTPKPEPTATASPTATPGT